MRTMMKVTIPVEGGNKAVKDGSLGAVIENTFADIKPESAYFTAEGGKRTAFLYFDLKDVSDIPRIAERFFMQLHAEVEMMPVMNLEDLKKGLSKIG